MVAGMEPGATRVVRLGGGVREWETSGNCEWISASLDCTDNGAAWMFEEDAIGEAGGTVVNPDAAGTSPGVVEVTGVDASDETSSYRSGVRSCIPSSGHVVA